MVLMMLCALFPAVIFAEETDFGVGDTGTAEIAPSSGVSVYKSPSSAVESNIFPVGTAVNVPEAYVTENRHYIHTILTLTILLTICPAVLNPLTEKRLPPHIPKNLRAGNFISVRKA